MKNNLVQLEVSQHFATITFNDPDRLNALSLEMAAVFPQIIDELKSQSDLRCVVLTGAGRAFSAGGNLDMIAEKKHKTAEQNTEEMLQFYSSFLCIRDLPVPTIAAINGHAIGAGLCVALACDLRVASESAKLGVNFTKLGLSPGMAGSWLITQAASTAVAKDLLFTGRTLSAAEAFQLGLVQRLVTPENFDQAVQDLAQEICANGPIALRETKQLIEQNAQKPLPEALLAESKAQAVCFHSEDLQDGVAAIRAKRVPEFKNR